MDNKRGLFLFLGMDTGTHCKRENTLKMLKMHLSWTLIISKENTPHCWKCICLENISFWGRIHHNVENQFVLKIYYCEGKYTTMLKMYLSWKHIILKENTPQCWKCICLEHSLFWRRIHHNVENVFVSNIYYFEGVYNRLLNMHQFLIR